MIVVKLKHVNQTLGQFLDRFVDEDGKISIYMYDARKAKKYKCTGFMFYEFNNEEEENEMIYLQDCPKVKLPVTFDPYTLSKRKDVVYVGCTGKVKDVEAVYDSDNGDYIGEKILERKDDKNHSIYIKRPQWGVYVSKGKESLMYATEKREYDMPKPDVYEEIDRKEYLKMYV